MKYNSTFRSQLLTVKLILRNGVYKQYLYCIDKYVSSTISDIFDRMLLDITGHY